jgi:hypothetical protein
MEHQQQQQVVANPFIQFAMISAIDEQHRKQVNPRKRALKDAITTEMREKNEKLRTEDGKNYFVLGSKKHKPGLSKGLLARAYQTFQEQEHPEQELAPGEADRFAEHVEECREKASEMKTRVDHKKSRPPESFF